MEKTLKSLKSDIEKIEGVIENCYYQIESAEEGDTELISTLYSELREFQDILEEVSAEPVKPLKAKVKEYETATLPARKKTKGLVEKTTQRLDEEYGAMAAAIQAATQEALDEGDHEALAEIPDAPELAPGVTFAELKRARVVDLTKIPQEFLVVDEKKLEKALKEGANVPGAELQVVRSWRRAAVKGEKNGNA